MKVADSSWLLMNPRGIPYYRVAYDDRSLDQLTVQLQRGHAQIAEQNRAVLLDDIAALVVQQVVPLSTLLALLRYLQLERSCLVWKVYVRVMRHTLKAFEGRIEYAAFFIYNQELCGLLRVMSAESLCLRLWWNKVCCIGAPRNKPDCEDRDGSVTPRGVTWDFMEPTRSPTPTLEPAQSTGSS